MCQIPSLSEEEKRKLVDLLLSQLLKAKGASKVTTELSTEFLYLWSRDSLQTEDGIKVMLRMASLMDPEGIKSKLSEKGFEEVAKSLG